MADSSAPKPAWLHLISIVPKLTNENYQNWKFAILIILKRAECWEILVKDEPSLATCKWTNKALDTLTIISLMVDPTQYIYIHDVENGWNAWHALAMLYEKPSRHRAVEVLYHFFSVWLLLYHDKNTSSILHFYIVGDTLRNPTQLNWSYWDILNVQKK